MTMPHLQNCPHSGEGWCLECVGHLKSSKDSALSMALDTLEPFIETARAHAFDQAMGEFVKPWRGHVIASGLTASVLRAELAGVRTAQRHDTVLVSKPRLTELLNLIGDVWPLSAGAMFTIHHPKDADAPKVYAEALKKEAIIGVMNRVSAVWCEGELVVSGLFIGADGKPIVNEDGDDEAQNASDEQSQAELESHRLAEQQYHEEMTDAYGPLGY